MRYDSIDIDTITELLVFEIGRDGFERFAAIITNLGMQSLEVVGLTKESFLEAINQKVGEYTSPVPEIYRAKVFTRSVEWGFYAEIEILLKEETV